MQNEWPWGGIMWYHVINATFNEVVKGHKSTPICNGELG